MYNVNAEMTRNKKGRRQMTHIFNNIYAILVFFLLFRRLQLQNVLNYEPESY
jgi:hypothetical protein